MNQVRFEIKNREVLRADRETYPLLKHLLRVVTSSGVVTSLQIERTESLPQSGWLVFRGSCGRGFGIYLGSGAEVSFLQSSLDYVRNAHSLVKSFGGVSSFPYELSLSRCPPSEWRSYRVEGVAGSLLCSASSVASDLAFDDSPREKDPFVRLQLHGLARLHATPKVGESVMCGTIEISLPDIGVSGRGISRGGCMTIEVSSPSEIEERSVPGVRLDLGEIEVRLSDIVGLRPGAVINLGEVTLEKCFVRLGATVLAEGRFASHEGQLLLTIQSVL